MKTLLVLLPVIVLTASAEATAAQYVPLAGLSADRREELTLSRADIPGPACMLPIDKAQKPFATFIDQQKMQAILDSVHVTDSSKYALYSIKIDSAGLVTSRLIESTLSHDDVARISNAINTAFVGAGVKHFLTFRVRVQLGVVDEQLRLAPSVTCPPALMNLAEVQRALPHPGGLTPDVSPVRTTVICLVAVDGRIQDARVKVSSGNTFVDDASMAAFKRVARFRPEIVDGLETRAWISLDLVLRVR